MVCLPQTDRWKRCFSKGFSFWMSLVLAAISPYPFFRARRLGSRPLSCVMGRIAGAQTPSPYGDREAFITPKTAPIPFNRSLAGPSLCTSPTSGCQRLTVSLASPERRFASLAPNTLRHSPHFWLSGPRLELTLSLRFFALSFLCLIFSHSSQTSRLPQNPNPSIHLWSDSLYDRSEQ